jgi:dihydrofolate reductase
MISAIVAVDKNWGIGFNNDLLEHIPEDLKRFKELTTGNTVIMGRKTWDSLPKKPLPDRLNIIITSNPKENEENIKYMTLE